MVVIMKIGKQSFEFNQVYLLDTSVAIGSLEAKGKISGYADIIYDDSLLICRNFAY